MIDVRRLQVLRVLHEHETITAAADVLHLTPSAVSQQLRLLARDVGVELLHRDGRRVQLTSAAHVLLDHADRLYAQWEMAQADIAAHGRDAQAGNLSIAGFVSSFAPLLAPAASRLRRTNPRLNVRLLESESNIAAEQLLSGEADIAVWVITPETPPLDDPRFDQRSLLSDRLDLVVPESHPLATRDSVELAEVAEEPWVGPCLDHRLTILGACAAAGFAPKFAQSAQEWPAIIALVSHDFGVTLMPALAALPAEHGVVRVPLRGNPSPSRRVIMAVRRGSDRQPHISLGLETLRDIAQQLPLGAGGSPELVAS